MWVQDTQLLREHLAICEALSGSPQAREVALVLLEVERLLAQEEGCLSEEWRDVWQGPWRRYGQGILVHRIRGVCK